MGMTAIEELKAEHEAVLLTIRILDKITSKLEAGIPREGGPLGVMFYEHDQGRSFVQGLRSGVEDYRDGKDKAIAEISKYAQNYGQLLTAHIDKENNVLYVMAERVLSSDKMAEMAEAFAVIEETEIGPNKHAEFHRTLHALRDVYLTD